MVATLAAPPANVQAGKSFGLSGKTSNRGAAKAAASTTGYYLSTDSKLGGGDIRLGSHSVPRLAPRGSFSRKPMLRIPASARSGKRHLLACADRRATVRESNERNNCRVAKRRIRIVAGAVLGETQRGGSGPAALKLSVADHFFGAVSIGASSGAFTFTVTNSGGTSTGAVSATVDGPDASEFVVRANTCTGVLTAGASCTLRVTFVPDDAPGPRAATLRVSGAPGGTTSAALTGLADPPALTISPSSRELGAVMSGSSSGSFTFTIANTGLLTTALTTSLEGSHPSEFSTSANTCAATLGAGESCTVDVTFAPTGPAGARSAALEVVGHPGGIVSSALSGTAKPAPELAISPADLDFGSVAVGSSTAPSTFTVSNTGQATSGALSATLAGSDPSQFALSANTCTGTLAAGASCTMQVAFSPTGLAGSRAASLQVSGSPGGTVASALSGAAEPTPATLSMSPATREFGTVASGASSGVFTFTVTNTGQTTSGTLNTALAGSNPSQFAISSNTCTGTLAGGQSCTVRVTFAPTGAAGSRSASLEVEADPGNLAASALSGSVT